MMPSGPMVLVVMAVVCSTALAAVLLVSSIIALF
jgi:hypothetical protein